MESLLDLPSNGSWSACNVKGVGLFAMGKTFQNLDTGGTSCIFSDRKMKTFVKKEISKAKYYLLVHE